ncbi:hypothetical protein [Massilia sp. PWRC2]|uniref:hypothetical protein n=1 Tax=Massilia sp. PWRC2 TaxID=2804626 RepID=UPI003CEFB28D
MFNSTMHAASSSQPFSLVWLLETLLFVHLRETLAVDRAADQSDGAYHYGL